MLSVSGKVFVKPLLIASLGFILPFSGVSHAADIMSMKPFPGWFKKSIKRETTLKSESELKLDALNVNSKVLSENLIQEQGDGFWYVKLDIGTEAPVECYTFTVFDGPSNSLFVLMDNAINSMPDVYNKVLVGKFNFAQDVGLIGNAPYLSVDALYHLGKGKSQLYGLVKGLTAKTGNSLHVCIHNELGYRDTFLSVFTSFISAFNDGQESAAFFQSVYKLSIDEMPVGYVSEAYTSDADGDIAIVKNSSIAFPIDASALTRIDSVGQEWSSPEGALINATTYTVQNSELSSQYFLEKKAQHWRVDGEDKGEAIDSNMEHNSSEYNDDLVSSYGSYLALVDLLNSDKSSAQLPRWIPEAEPMKMSNTGVDKIVDNPEANLSFDMGPIKMQFLANPQGVLQSGSMEQAGLTLDMDLMYSKGIPKQP